MKLIKPSFEIIEQQPGLDGMFKQIELAGRNCYKSEGKITETSAKEFVDRIIKLNHGAVLEHGTVYLRIPVTSAFNYLGNLWVSECYTEPYSKVNICNDNYYVTTNYRILLQKNLLDDLKYLCEPTEHHEKRVCVRFICDRGVSHEFVRHKIILCVA
jgi:thymidylate synthase (FAD)